jgi:hypothetical protein
MGTLQQDFENILKIMLRELHFVAAKGIKCVNDTDRLMLILLGTFSSEGWGLFWLTPSFLNNVCSSQCVVYSDSSCIY